MHIVFRVIGDVLHFSCENGFYGSDPIISSDEINWIIQKKFDYLTSLNPNFKTYEVLKDTGKLAP